MPHNKYLRGKLTKLSPKKEPKTFIDKESLSIEGFFPSTDDLYYAIGFFKEHPKVGFAFEMISVYYNEQQYFLDWSTSPVIAIQEDGKFSTKNSFYQLEVLPEIQEYIEA